MFGRPDASPAPEPGDRFVPPGCTSATTPPAITAAARTPARTCSGRRVNTGDTRPQTSCSYKQTRPGEAVSHDTVGYGTGAGRALLGERVGCGAADVDVGGSFGWCGGEVGGLLAAFAGAPDAEVLGGEVGADYEREREELAGERFPVGE